MISDAEYEIALPTRLEHSLPLRHSYLVGRITTRTCTLCLLPPLQTVEIQHHHVGKLDGHVGDIVTGHRLVEHAVECNRRTVVSVQ